MSAGSDPAAAPTFTRGRLKIAIADVLADYVGRAYEPDVRHAHLVFQLRPGAYNDQAPIEFLIELNELEQPPVLVL